MSERSVGRTIKSAYFIGIVTTILVTAIDQAAKVTIETRLPIGASIDILPILALFRVHNTGMAFSFLANSGVPLIAIVLFGTATMIVLWVREPNHSFFTPIAFGLIIGGALGNLIDRIRLGYVTDFLLLHFGDRVLFVFNLADTAVASGLLLIAYLLPGARRASSR